MNLRTILSRLALVAAAGACMAPGCNGDVLNDSTFRLWCGDALCDWKLDTGHIRRASTWHQDDYGVELLDNPTQISQETTEGSECMQFSAVADVEAAAQAEIQVDFDLDGTADFTAPIPESHWSKTKTLIYAPKNYGTHIRFIVRKRGDGRAVLAEIRLQRVTSCSGSRIQIDKLVVGEICGPDAKCEDGAVCCPFGGPEPDGQGVCSQCCDAQGAQRKQCTGGAWCVRPDNELQTNSSAILPLLCDPGKKHGKTGDPCVASGDCESNVCDGGAYDRGQFCGDAGTGPQCDVVSLRAGKCK